MDTLVLSATQDMMSTSGEGRGLGVHQKCHHNNHHYRQQQQQQQQLDYVHAIEEYVLDEHNLNTLQLFSMPLERRHQDQKPSQIQQHQLPPPPPPPQHVVRSSAELKTVSIIETLSELVSRTDSTGHHLGRQHDCDGQCSGECSNRNGGGSANLNGITNACSPCCSAAATTTTTCKKFSVTGNELDEELNQRVCNTSGNNGGSGRSHATKIGDSCCHLENEKQNNGDVVSSCKSSNYFHCKECNSLLSLPVPFTSPPLPPSQLAQNQLTTSFKNWTLENVVNSVSLARPKAVDQENSGGKRQESSSQFGLTKHQSSNAPVKNRREKGGSKMTVSRLKKKTVNALLSGGGGGGGGGEGHSSSHQSRSVNGATIVQRPTACPNGHAQNSITSTVVNHIGSQNCASMRHQRDPSHFMLSTLKSKGRTPDWIAGIFSIARRGSLEKLMQALTDMDATLIRNLSDHRGNNLFHVCCCFGHLECLQWLMQRGKQCEDAILDENKYELTPLVCAVKYGKLPCVEWLITNSVARGQLVPSNGGRPLLHWAAKYGQEVILRWLAQFMENNDMGVNVKDGYGNTALHLAAKHGHAVSIKALVTHRCDVSLKNDLGYKASDYAILYGQTTCSEYLLSLEACLILSADVASLDMDLNCTKTEMTEMKTQFKEVLSCAKKLIKEREELSQHLDQLQDGLVHLNNVLIAEIQSLCEENRVLRNNAAGTTGKTTNHSHTLDETVALCHAMHTRWQEGQQRWFSPTALSEIQQKILLAEERWKRARARVTWGEKESKEHMNVFRERLTQVQCRTTGIRLSDIRSVSSSESSLASMEEDTLSDYEDRCGMPTTVSSSRTNPSGCPDCCCTCHEWKFFENHCYQQPPPPPPPPNLCFSTPIKSHVIPPPKTKHIVIPGNKTKHVQEPPPHVSQKRNSNVNRPMNVDFVKEGTCKVLEVIAAPATSNCIEKEPNFSGKQESLIEFINGEHNPHSPWNIVNSSYVEFGAKEELSNLTSVKSKVCESTSKKFLKMNNSGDCKSELIVPGKRDDRHNDDDDDDRNFNASFDVRSRVCDQQQQQNSAEQNSRNVSSKSENKNTSSSSGVHSESHSTGDLASHAVDKLNDKQKADHGVAGGGGKLIFSEPDLIMGTKSVRKNNEDVSSCSHNNKQAELKYSRTATESVNDSFSAAEESSQDKVDDSIAVDDEEATPLLPQLENDSPNARADPEETQLQPSCSHTVSTGGPLGRRKGFLQKLNLRWPSKRTKVNVKISKKNQGQPQEITPEDFRETYMHLNRSNSGDEGGAAEGDANESAVPLLNQELPLATTTKASRSSKDTLKDSTEKSSISSNSGETASTSIPVKQKSKIFAVNDTDETTNINLAKKLNLMIDSALTSSSATVGTGNVVKTELLTSPPGKSDALPPPPPSCLPPAGTTKRDVPIPPLPFNHCELSDSVIINGLRPSSGCSRDMQNSGELIVGAKNLAMNAACKEESTESHADEDELPCNKAEDRDCMSSPGVVLNHQENSHVIENLPDNAHSVHAQANFPPQRPSSGAKSIDMNCSVSRPESSASRSEPTYLAFRHLPGFPLHKVASISTDLLTPDSLTPSRMSPAPSEVSKTESALSPPSDISKTESMRHMRQLTRIEENISNRESRPLPALPIRRYDDVKRANIVDISTVEMHKQSVAQHKQPLNGEGNGNKEFLESKSKEMSAGEEAQTSNKDKTKTGGVNLCKGVNKRSKLSKEEKPWYDLSDDEEMMMSDVRLRSADFVKGHGSSEDDEAYFCAH